MSHSMNALSHGSLVELIPKVAVASSKPREGAVGSYVSSVIRFTFFGPHPPFYLHDSVFSLAERCILFSSDPHFCAPNEGLWTSPSVIGKRNRVRVIRFVDRVFLFCCENFFFLRTASALWIYLWVLRI